MRCDTVWINARLAPLAPQGGVVAARDGRIVWAGANGDAPSFEAGETVDCEGRWITPGLIDPHTHLVHGGDRAREFELRLAGVTREAARALGMLRDVGTLEAGKACDLAIWDVERPAELVYRIGFNPLHSRVLGGQTTWTR